MLLFIVLSSLPHKGYICLVLLFIAALLLARLDAQPNYVYLLNILRHFCYKRRFARVYTDEVLVKKANGEFVDHAVNVLFKKGKGAGASGPEGETKREKKARMKAEAKERKEEEKLRKAEDKVLKDPKAPQEERTPFWPAVRRRTLPRKRRRPPSKRRAKRN
jgi:hypothetical protein